MKAIVFDLYLCQSVLVAATEPGDENSAEGLAYIPGSSIRGAMIALRLAQLKKKKFDLKSDEQEKSWFFQDLAFLNAYPFHPDGVRMLPTPLSWRVEKDYRQSPNASIQDAASGGKVSFESPASLFEPFTMFAASGKPQLFNPSRSIRIHNSGWTRRIKGEGNSQVFRYTALAEGQIFRAVIVGKNVDSFANQIQLQNGTQLSVGRSRSADYGRVEVRNLTSVEDWEEAPFLPRNWNAQSGKRLALILASDAILRDSAGLPVCNLDHEMGVPALESWYRVCVSGGFNRAWGMPVPQEIALQAGSVFVYDAASVDPKKVQDLLEYGAGLRRLEGYGRLRAVLEPAFEMQREDIPYSIGAASEKSSPLLTGSSEKIAQRIGERFLTQLLEEKLAAAVANLSLQGIKDRAQLSRLRLVARLAMEKSDLTVLTTHLNDLKSSQEKIRQARLKMVSAQAKNGPRLNEWIEMLEKESRENGFWQTPDYLKDWGWHQFLAPDSIEQSAMIGLEPKEEVLALLKRRFIARLIDGLFNKAAREAQREQRNEMIMEESYGNE